MSNFKFINITQRQDDKKYINRKIKIVKIKKNAKNNIY